MELGEKIKQRRKEKGITQAKLAEELEVSTEAVSKWEQGLYQPSNDKLAKLDELLELSLLDDTGKPKDGRFFHEDRMSAFLKGKLNAGKFPEASRAIVYAKEKHAGQPRKGPGNVPYINHPLTMACHAFALGLEDDALISALLLHDVAEDCGVAAKDLPFSPEIREIVGLVTKAKTGFSEEKYFDAIKTSMKACLVKCIDRCNNLTSMSLGFPDEKIAEYVEETEKWFPPLLDIIKNHPEYNNAAWLLKYQIKGLLEMAKRIR